MTIDRRTRLPERSLLPLCCGGQATRRRDYIARGDADADEPEGKCSAALEANPTAEAGVTDCAPPNRDYELIAQERHTAFRISPARGVVE